MKIYEICRENRLVLGLTIDEFAMSVGIDSILYSKFEKGEYAFSKETIKKILDNLYVEENDLYRKTCDHENIEEYITSISMRVIDECEKGE